LKLTIFFQLRRARDDESPFFVIHLGVAGQTVGARSNKQKKKNNKRRRRKKGNWACGEKLKAAGGHSGKRRPTTEAKGEWMARKRPDF
jgi:hypothetical protein